MVEPATRGDPESPLRWTSKSTRQLADALTEAGHPASYRTVAGLLHRLGYSLQGASKTRELTSHPDRDLQFRYLGAQVKAHLDARQPVVSVDTNTLWVTSGDDLVKMDITLGREVDRFNLDDIGQGSGLAEGVAVGGGSVWLSRDVGRGQILRLDPRHRNGGARVERRHPVPEPHLWRWLAVDRRRRRHRSHRR